MMRLKLKRIYAPPEPADGTRILVDRLWPRGIAKEKAGVDLWLKELAPSDALRKRFHAKPDEWDEFRRDYAEELTDAREAVAELQRHLREGPVTLLYAARDEDRNNAVALQAWLDRR